MMKTAIAPILCALIITTGCTVPWQTTRTLEAQDRVITGVKRTIEVGGKTETIPIICPEPSPDALKTIAVSGSAAKQDIASIAASYGESAANIGLRTHSIQLLRDQLFSICQAYANGAISPSMYKMHLNRNQRNTVAIMAIEQLTGVVRAPNVVLSSSSSVEHGKNLLEQTNQVNEAEKKYAALEDKTTDEAKNLRATIDALKQKLEQDRASLVTTSALASSLSSPVIQLDAKALEAVADTVNSIAQAVFNDNDFLYLCLEVYADEPTSNLFKDACDAAFARYAQHPEEGPTMKRHSNYDK